MSTDACDPYDEYNDDEHDHDRRYRAVQPLAVLSLVFGALSIATIFNWFFGLVPVAGIVLGTLALRRINRSPQELQGRGFAVGGIALSTVLGFVGLIGLGIRVQYLVPAGYRKITFANLRGDPNHPDQLVPAEATELKDQRVFIRGYMYPGRQVFNIKEFTLVPTAGLCKFCITDVDPRQMVRVEMVGDVRANYTTRLSGVGGVFKIDPQVGVGVSPYRIEADVFR